MITIAEKLDTMIKENNYSREALDLIADELEEEFGSAALWDTLRLGFETSEYMENLIYLAKELDA